MPMMACRCDSGSGSCLSQLTNVHIPAHTRINFRIHPIVPSEFLTVICDARNSASTACTLGGGGTRTTGSGVQWRSPG